MRYPKLKSTVKVARCSVADGRARLQIGSFQETGLSLEGPAYLPELLGCLDGSRTEPEILERLAADGHRPPAQEVAGLLAQLNSCGLLGFRDDSEGVSSPLSAEEEKRYYKHLLFYGLFVDEAEARRMQALLARKTVALIGMGGIGGAAAYQLAAAGVGRLIGADADVIELGNLTRQVLYRTEDVGRRKVDAAAERLAEYNPGSRFIAHPRAVASAEDIASIVRGCDFAILSADSPDEIPGWMNQACVEAGVPFTSSGYSGHVAVCGPLIVPGRTACLACAGADRRPGTSRAAEVNARYAVPSFGPINHLSASLACAEALKFLTGCAAPQTLGVRYLFDPVRFEGRRISVPRDPGCSVCARHA